MGQVIADHGFNLHKQKMEKVTKDYSAKKCNVGKKKDRILCVVVKGPLV